jgi:putative hydrolase of the HAD superfamily
LSGRRSSEVVLWIDFGGVLTSPVAHAWQALADRAEVPAETLAAAVSKVAADFGMEMLEPLERGAVSQHEWGRLVAEALAPLRSRLDLTRWAEHWYAGRRVNTERLAALHRFKQGGARLGLLTNSVREWEPLRAALLPENGLFDVQIKSHEIGLRKPDPEIYALAESAFGARSGRCVIVDDTRANCEAALARNWSAVHHTSTSATIAALAALGV